LSRDKDVAVFIPADNLAAGVVGNFDNLDDYDYYETTLKNNKD